MKDCISFIGCDPNFVPDLDSNYCYLTVSTLENLDDGEKICQNAYDAELVTFNNNVEIIRIISLIKSGGGIVIE